MVASTSVAVILGAFLFVGYFENYFVMPSNRSSMVQVELHMIVEQYRNGKLMSRTIHAMTLTNFGKNWIADNLANAAGTNVTKFARYIGVSNDSSTVDVAWTVLPSEITDGGLARAEGNWADTGVGTWNMSKSFSVTATRSTKLYGLYLDTYATQLNSLVAAEQQGVGSQKNLASGDTLVVTVQGTVS